MNSFSLTGIFFLNTLYIQSTIPLSIWYWVVSSDSLTCLSRVTRHVSVPTEYTWPIWVELNLLSDVSRCPRFELKVWMWWPGITPPTSQSWKKIFSKFYKKNIFSFNNKILSESNNKILSDCHHKSFLIFMIHRFITRSWTKNEGL